MKHHAYRRTDGKIATVKRSAEHIRLQMSPTWAGALDQWASAIVPLSRHRLALPVARTVIAIWLPPAPASESTSDKRWRRVTVKYSGVRGWPHAWKSSCRYFHRRVDSCDRVISAVNGCKCGKTFVVSCEGRLRKRRTEYRRDYRTGKEREREKARQKIAVHDQFESRRISANFAR